MLELLTVLGVFFLVGALLFVCLKVLCWVVVLPIKLGLFLVQGLLALVLFIPALIISIVAAAFILPVFLSVIVVPVVFAIAGIAVLLRFFA